MAIRLRLRKPLEEVLQVVVVVLGFRRLLFLAHQPELLEVLPGAGYIAAEALYAVRHEGALHLEDVLARRMRISIETIDRGTEIADRVASLIAPELGWSDDDIAAEVQRWHDRVDAEVGANATPDDETAQSVRRTAVDGRGLVEA